MQAIVVSAFGGPENLELKEIAPPRPGAGEALVRLEWAGVNFIDVYMRNGTYARSSTYLTPLPMTVGMEGAGTVAEIGEGATDFTVGQRVAWCLALGSYAEFAAVPARRLVPVPENVDLRTAAALMLQGSTAHYLTHSAFPLKPGDTCLVHAAAGGVGQLLVQLAKSRGAKVIATVGSAEKARVAKVRGADHCILYRETDFGAAVRELTGGRGVDVVYDSVGRDTISQSIRCLRRRGLCVLFGASSGPVPTVEPSALAEAGSVFFTRPHLADYLADPEETLQRANDLFMATAAGWLSVRVDAEFPLAEAAEAHRRLEARVSRGKLLLRVA